MSSIIRSMARSIAKNTLKKKGYSRNSYGKENWSEFFHNNWRKNAHYIKGVK